MLKEEVYKKQGFGVNRIGFGAKPAIIVVDMQKDFIDEDAPSTCHPSTTEIIPHIQSLLVIARKKKVPIFYSQGVVHPSLVEVGFWKSKAHKEGKVQIEGSKGVEITEKLKPTTEDFIIKKRRPSAFFRTDLDIYLSGLKVDTLIITGTSMSGCVRATATDAFMRDFRTMIVRECVADRVPEVLDSNLFDMDAKYCDVVSLQETLDYLNTL